MQPSRLLLVTERFFPDVGGVAHSATRTATAIAALGVETHVLAWSRMLPAGQLETRVTEGSTPGGARLVVHRLGLFANLDYSLQHTITLLEAMHRRHPFDGIWGHYISPAGFLAVLFGESMAIPVTVSARGNDVDMLMFPPRGLCSVAVDVGAGTGCHIGFGRFGTQDSRARQNPPTGSGGM